MDTKTKEFSFWKGWSQVRLKDQKEVQRKIMEALNMESRMAWYQRRVGNIEPKVTEAREIEKVFAEYGIKEVWGAKL